MIKRNLNVNKNFQYLPDILTLKDIENFLGIGKTLAYKLISKKEINSFKIGREIKVLKKDLENYIELRLKK